MLKSLKNGFKSKKDQAVLIDFDITGLVDPVSEIDALETALNHVLGSSGESDGHELSQVHHNVRFSCKSWWRK